MTTGWAVGPRRAIRSRGRGGAPALSGPVCRASAWLLISRGGSIFQSCEARPVLAAVASRNSGNATFGADPIGLARPEPGPPGTGSGLTRAGLMRGQRTKCGGVISPRGGGGEFAGARVQGESPARMAGESRATVGSCRSDSGTWPGRRRASMASLNRMQAPGHAPHGSAPGGWSRAGTRAGNCGGDAAARSPARAWRAVPVRPGPKEPRAVSRWGAGGLPWPKSRSCR